FILTQSVRVDSRAARLSEHGHVAVKWRRRKRILHLRLTRTDFQLRPFGYAEHRVREDLRTAYVGCDAQPQAMVDGCIGPLDSNTSERRIRIDCESHACDDALAAVTELPSQFDRCPHRSPVQDARSTKCRCELCVANGRGVLISEVDATLPLQHVIDVAPM